MSEWSEQTYGLPCMQHVDSPHSCTQAFHAAMRPSLSPDGTSPTLTVSTRSGRSCMCPLMLLLTCGN